MNTKKATTLLLLAMAAMLTAVIAAAQQDVGQVRLVSLSKPVYSPLARQANITGVVVVEVAVNQDGTTKAAIVSGHPMLRESALTSARESQFECRMCNAPHSYSLVYVFKQSNDGDCCNGLSVTPTVQQSAQSKNAQGQEQTEVTSIAQQVCLCDPASTVTKRVRSPKCLYLWKCSTVTR